MTDATKRLYHYTGKQFGLKSLWERRLKISRYEELNDPFELLPFDLTRRESRAFWEAEVHRILSGDHGVLSFSEDWRTSEMWSRYADKHAGLCLGFDVPVALAEPICYVEQRLKDPVDPERTLRGVAVEVVEAALRHKHAAWSHEREWRLRARLGEAVDGIFYKRFDDELHLREVIIGARSSLSVDDVEEAVSSPPMDVEIFQAQAALGAFEIVRHLEATPRMIRGFRARLALARDLFADDLPDDDH